MFKKLSAFALLLLHSYNARRGYQLAAKSHEVKMLLRRLGTTRIIATPEERREMIALCAKFDHQVDPQSPHHPLEPVDRNAHG